MLGNLWKTAGRMASKAGIGVIGNTYTSGYLGSGLSALGKGMHSIGSSRLGTTLATGALAGGIYGAASDNTSILGGMAMGMGVGYGARLGRRAWKLGAKGFDEVRMGIGMGRMIRRDAKSIARAVGLGGGKKEATRATAQGANTTTKATGNPTVTTNRPIRRAYDPSRPTRAQRAAQFANVGRAHAVSQARSNMKARLGVITPTNKYSRGAGYFARPDLRKAYRSPTFERVTPPSGNMGLKRHWRPRNQTQIRRF